MEPRPGPGPLGADFAQRPGEVLAHAVAGFTRPLALAGIVVMFACLTIGQAFTRSLLPERAREHLARRTG